MDREFGIGGDHVTPSKSLPSGAEAKLGTRRLDRDYTTRPCGLIERRSEMGRGVEDRAARAAPPINEAGGSLLHKGKRGKGRVGDCLLENVRRFIFVQHFGSV